MEKEKLPKGIYFEKSRRRYRVRLYRGGEVVARSYHRTLDSAISALEKAKKFREELKPPEPKSVSLNSIVSGLREKVPFSGERE